MCAMTHLHVWHDAFICVTWCIHMWHDAFICDMTHSYVTWLVNMWHDSFTPALIDTTCPSRSFASCDMWKVIQSHVWMSHDTHMDGSCHTHSCHTYVAWLIHMNQHITHMNASCHMCEWPMSHICTTTYERCISYTWMRHVTHMNASCHTYECVMSHIWMHHVAHMHD